MSDGDMRKLVMMANQIATAFEGQRGDAVRDAAAHMQAFWSRPMREKISRHLALGGEGLTPTARLAAARLAPVAAARED